MTVIDHAEPTPAERSPAPRRRPLAVLGWVAIGVAAALVVVAVGLVALARPASPIPPAGKGWRLTMADTFGDRSLDHANWWGAYSGQPGGDPAGWWDPTHVELTGHGLTLRTFRATTPHGVTWVSGGIGEVASRAQTYGRYLVRMRSDPGRGISTIALLWPVQGWPPEIDFFESAPDGGRPSGSTATLHSGSDNRLTQRDLPGIDLSAWHTYGVEWLPGKLTYSVDGRVWATMVGDQVPSVPMTLDLQTQALACTDQVQACADQSTPPEVDTSIAWVATYAPVGAS